MKQFALTFFATLLLSGTSLSQIIYVKAGSNGNGQSWETPANSLSRALQVATPGTQIWVAEGTYFPSLCKHCTKSDRSESFKIPSGVKVFGGFAGHETSIEQRNIKKHTTQLSGHIGADDPFDNSQTVVSFENADKETQIDGFTIIGGVADNKEANDGHASRSGAAIYNLATDSEKSTPIIKNCLFFENTGAEGGAIFNYSEKGIAGITAINCTFLKNQSVNAGGAVMDNCTNMASSTFENCKFINNISRFGGGYFSANANPKEEIFDNCKFINNESEYGAAGFISAESNGTFYTQNCTFLGNKSKDKQTIYYQQRNNLNEVIKETLKAKAGFSL